MSEKTWLFNEFRPNDVDEDSHLAEFFSSQEVGNVADNIVRESIQNSLDANDRFIKGGFGAGRLEMRFSLGSVQTSSLTEIMPGLWPHIEASRIEDPDFQEKISEHKKRRKMNFLLIEDFNTTGLRGDPRDWRGKGDKEQNEFYYFLRARGKSSKTGVDRGNWGIGKVTYFELSEINTMFVSTVRVGETPEGGKGPLMIAQTSLTTHDMGGKTFYPDGYWGVPDEIEGHPITIPVDVSSPDQENLLSVFGVERDVEEPGLSVVVPFVQDDFNFEVLKKSILRNYGLAILRGELSVQIEDEKDNLSNLNSESILDEVEKLKDIDEMYGLLKHLEAVNSKEQAKKITLDKHPVEVRPDWRTEGFLTEDQANEIKTAIDGDKNVLVRVPLDITPKTGRGCVEYGIDEGESVDSYFEILFCREKGVKQPAFFYREGLRISKAGHRQNCPRPADVWTTVLIDHPNLARFLGDAEEISHREWKASTERFKGKYAHGAAWIYFVEDAPGRITELLKKQDREEDTLSTEGIFSIEKLGKKGPRTKKKTGKARVTSLGKNEILNITQIKGGVTVSLLGGLEESRIPKVLELHFAYDTSDSGNPITKWRIGDFSLMDEKFSVDSTGGTHERKVLEKLGSTGKKIRDLHNVIEVKVEDPEKFKLTVTGFSDSRDLAVDDLRTK